ncbi:MAG: (d)CMP kinase [Actinobacteria bacterium]|nr:(d)CMP kinase [Actinomycetota bacterium]
MDGPSGVGKSTVTRRVAAARGVDYLDTGSMYRAATVAALRAGVPLDDPVAVTDVIERSDIRYVDGVILLNGEDVSDDVRTDEVTGAVSAVSAIPAVRHRLVEFQRAWVTERGGNAVVEGRDIGTVVFPDAPAKIFLTARPEVRSARRAGDAEAANLSAETIETKMRERDRQDSTRAVSPLAAADDAIIIDTSDLSLGEVVESVLEVVAHARC